MSFDYAVTSGGDTQALLKAFQEVRSSFKANGIKSEPIVTMQPRPAPQREIAKAAQKTAYLQTIGYSGELGSLAAKFESGEMGIAAIGYDRNGGTSYGKYQISSRAGTMKNFITYLEGKAPDLAQRLAQAGPANTGGRTGKMPAEWKKIAAEQPEKFENLQSDFIKSSHYEPALAAVVSSTGINNDALHPAIQEVIFSTSVQHGPAGAIRILNRAIEQVGAERLQASVKNNTEAAQKIGNELIRNIYSLRSKQFGSSSSRIQASVQNRLRQEMRDAITLLQTGTIQA